VPQRASCIRTPQSLKFDDSKRCKESQEKEQTMARSPPKIGAKCKPSNKKGQNKEKDGLRV
jgi:hypothetical protein